MAVRVGGVEFGTGTKICYPEKAFSSKLCYEHFREEFGLETAVFQILRGGVAAQDLATVQMSDGKSLIMTILSSWGIIADIDIESEKFRSLGKARFVLGMPPLV